MVFILFSFLSFNLYTETQVLNVCALETGYAPYTTSNGDGRWQLLIASALKDLKIEVKYQYAPRERCLLKIKRGEVDAVFAGVTTERMAYMTFPRKKNKEIDTSKALGTIVYRIYKKKDSNIDWDGKEFLNLGNKTVGVQRGLQVMTDLQAKNIKTDGDLVATAEQNLIKLNLGRIVAAAVEENQGDKILEDYNFQSLTKLSKPFSTSTVYLALSLSYYAKNTILAEKIWGQIKLNRKKGFDKSPAFISGSLSPKMATNSIHL